MVAPISYLEVNCNMVMKKVSVDVVYTYVCIYMYLKTYFHVHAMINLIVDCVAANTDYFLLTDYFRKCHILFPISSMKLNFFKKA